MYSLVHISIISTRKKNNKFQSSYIDPFIVEYFKKKKLSSLYKNIISLTTNRKTNGILNYIYERLGFKTINPFLYSTKLNLINMIEHR